MLTTFAVAAALGIVITTATSIGAGLFLQQANASACLNIQDKSLACNPNSFRSQAFNYQGMDEPGQPYLYKELPNNPNSDQPPIVLGTSP